MIASSALHNHNCDGCLYLGTLENMDIYWHPRRNHSQYILRSSWEDSPQGHGGGGEYFECRDHQDYRYKKVREWVFPTESAELARLTVAIQLAAAHIAYQKLKMPALAQTVTP